MWKSQFLSRWVELSQQGDYFLPNLTVPESVFVGVWGQRHLRYIREYRKNLYKIFSKIFENNISKNRCRGTRLCRTLSLCSLFR